MSKPHVLEYLGAFGIVFGMLMGLVVYYNPQVVPKVIASPVEVTATEKVTLVTTATEVAAVEPTSTPLPPLPNFGFENLSAPNAQVITYEAVKKFIVAYAANNGGFGISGSGGFSTVDPDVIVPVINGGVIMAPCEVGVPSVITGYRFIPQQPHPGTDTSCGLDPDGTSVFNAPILAPFPGIVIGVGYIDVSQNLSVKLWVSGNVVMIKGGLANEDGSNLTEYMWLCGHMTGEDMPDLGSFVNSGQIVGRIGSTGNSTGPHCHQALWVNGEFVDPETTNLVGTRTEKPQIYGGVSCTYTVDDLRSKASALAERLGIPTRIQLALWSSESNFSHCWEGTPYVKINDLGAIGVGQIYLAVHPNLNPNSVLYDVDANMQYADDILLQKYEVCSGYSGEMRWFCAVAYYKGITQTDFQNHRDFKIFMDKYAEEN